MPGGPSRISMYAEITQVKIQNIKTIQQADTYHICTFIKANGIFSGPLS